MRRRNFIALVGGAAAWPMATRAQQRQSVRIGVLGGYVVDDPEIQARIAAFRQGMQEQGWNEGSNLQIDYRWAGPDAERIKTFATELVATSPRVILAIGSPSVAALRKVTHTGAGHFRGYRRSGRPRFRCKSCAARR